MATLSLDLDLYAKQKPAYLPELIWHDTEDGMVIVSPTAGKVRVLNKVGGTLWPCWMASIRQKCWWRRWGRNILKCQKRS
jgi:hypothetical protein